MADIIVRSVISTHTILKTPSILPWPLPPSHDSHSIPKSIPKGNIQQRTSCDDVKEKKAHASIKVPAKHHSPKEGIPKSSKPLEEEEKKKTPP